MDLICINMGYYVFNMVVKCYSGNRGTWFQQLMSKKSVEKNSDRNSTWKNIVRKAYPYQKNSQKSETHAFSPEGYTFFTILKFEK